VVIVGGVDSYIDVDTLDWLHENDQWQGEDTRAGFIPGEGAAFVALMRPADARSAGLPPLALVRAVASTRESKLIKTDAVALGEGLTAAVAQAIAPLSAAGAVVEEAYGDINGERYRSEEWGFVALRLGAAFRDATQYRTAASAWGDVGAATGALNLILSTQAWQRGHATGQHALVWGSSEGGLRTAVLLERAPRTP
jgi:3-oxoacyl-[acyl-carrier-protein] synthase-1